MNMRWSYKTVHFELKKEGLLGGGFLDESEIEQELNEFGLAGWELVSVLEVQDGVIAFFKQPLYREGSVLARQVTDLEHEKENRVEDQQQHLPTEDDRETTAQNHDDEDASEDESLIGAIKIE